MANRRVGLIALLLFICFSIASFQVLAASTTEAIEPISSERTCSLTLSYCHDGTAFANVPVKVYKIADVSADFQYTLSASMAASNLELNGVQSMGEWNVIRSTLEAYIVANGSEADVMAATDANGLARLETLETGLYLIAAGRVVQNNVEYAFDAALLSLPTLKADGTWEYAVSVSAKSEIIPPTSPDAETDWKVVKLWKGDEGRTDRPKSVEVEIFRDGVSYQTVTLSEANHWAYSWSVKGDAQFTVMERHVPSGYTVTVEGKGTAFVLTNTRTPDSSDPPIKPPHTGDTVNVWLYILLMNVSGILLIIVGVTGKRKRL